MLLLIIALFVAGTIVVAWTVAGRRLEEVPDQPKTVEAGTLLSILVPKMNDKTPLAAEMMFSSMHGLLSKTPGLQEHLSFELVATPDGIRFYVYLPTYFRNFVESQIYAQYPNANITEVESDYTQDLSSASTVVTATEMTLDKDFFNPIKTFVDFQVDPLAAITGSVEHLNPGEQVWMQLLLQPIDNGWQEAGYAYVAKVKSGKKDEPKPSFIAALLTDIKNELINIPMSAFTGILGETKPVEKKDEPPKLSAGQELELKAIENKMTKLGFETSLRIVSIGQNELSSQQALASIIASLKQFTLTHLNSFQRSPVDSGAEAIFHNYQARAFPPEPENCFILNTEEVASIYHLPNLSVETPTIAWSKAKQLEPPLDIPLDVSTTFAQTAFRSRSIEFGIKREDRRRHMYMIGKTGTGKSTLMENMILKDILAGEGVAVMDPHGDMIDKLLDNIPEERINDVVLFDPSDTAFPVSLNMLELMDPNQKNLTASAMVDVFKRTFDSWGPRLEYILRNCFLTLVEVPNTTLLGVNRLLLDKDYRKYIVNLLEDEQLRQFWVKEYATMASNDKLITEAVAPIQNKVGQFLQTSTIRNIMGQAKSTIKVDEIMNTQKIFLVNLSKGKIGNDNSALLGSMIIARLQSAAMTRVNIPEHERKDFYVYADEFQNFATSAFATILSEARKYRLNLVITHQYIDQLPEEVRNAVFGNVGTTISFTVGPNDASTLAAQFAPVLTAEDMVALEKHHIYLKLMIDGMESRPFSASTLPPIARHEGHKAAIIEASRAKYARPLAEVEDRITRWSLKKFQIGVDDAVVRKIRGQEPLAGDPVTASPSVATTTSPTSADQSTTAAPLATPQGLVGDLPNLNGKVDPTADHAIHTSTNGSTHTSTNNQPSAPISTLATDNQSQLNVIQADAIRPKHETRLEPTPTANGQSGIEPSRESNGNVANGQSLIAQPNQSIVEPTVPNPNGHTNGLTQSAQPSTPSFGHLNGHNHNQPSTPNQSTEPSQPAQPLTVINGVPGGIGHTNGHLTNGHARHHTVIHHQVTSDSSGEIILTKSDTSVPKGG